MSYKGHDKSNVYESEKGYDMYAKDYDKKKIYLNSFEKDVLKTFLKETNGKKVLDLGCGTGRLIEMLIRENDVTGIDLSQKMLDIARKKFPGAKFIQGDIQELPFEDESFDVVICAFAIVHLGTLDQLFEEVYRVLKPGGFFIVTNINQRKPPKIALSAKDHIIIKSFYHRPQEVVENLEKVLFDIEKEEFVKENGVWINQIIKAKK